MYTLYILNKQCVCSLAVVYTKRVYPNTIFTSTGTYPDIFIKGGPELWEAPDSNDLVELGLICAPLLFSSLIELLRLSVCLSHIYCHILFTTTLTVRHM